MKRFWWIVVIDIIILTIVFSCGGGSKPAEPDDDLASKLLDNRDDPPDWLLTAGIAIIGLGVPLVEAVGLVVLVILLRREECKKHT